MDVSAEMQHKLREKEREKDHTWDQDAFFSYRVMGGVDGGEVCFKFWAADFYYCIVKRNSSVRECSTQVEGSKFFGHAGRV